jgi:hypothetical protein
MPLVDRLISKVDRIRQRVNVDKVGVRRYDLVRVIRTWSGGEVGDGSITDSETTLSPAPAITLGRESDRLSGRGRVPVGKMQATEISLTYTEAFLQGTPLGAGQECFYKLVERNVAQAAGTTYWVMENTPEADRCEEPGGNIQWVANFRQREVPHGQL